MDSYSGFAAHFCALLSISSASVRFLNQKTGLSAFLKHHTSMTERASSFRCQETSQSIISSPGFHKSSKLHPFGESAADQLLDTSVEIEHATSRPALG